MNKQGPNGIEWTDFTWNPIKGCFHDCQWTMPDGSLANCYAEDVAENFATRAYPYGFSHHYWAPHILDEPLKLKQPSRIFVGSMADVFGHWVPEDNIREVLDVCRQAHWHTFQLLTKNVKRVAEFDIPDNCWVGASIPPSFMWGKPLTQHQQARMLETTIATMDKLPRHIRKWISAEPLSWDIVDILASSFFRHTGLPFDWMVIGAASNGKIKYAPNDYTVYRLVHFCDNMGIRVFFKGNMRASKWAAANWRQGFPV